MTWWSQPTMMEPWAPAHRAVRLQLPARERSVVRNWLEQGSTWAQDDRDLDDDATSGDPHLIDDLTGSSRPAT